MELINEDTAIALIKTALCPSCDGSGAYYDCMGEVCQCQWCYECNILIKQYEDEH